MIIGSSRETHVEVPRSIAATLANVLISHLNMFLIPYNVFYICYVSYSYFKLFICSFTFCLHPVIISSLIAH